MNTMTDSSDRTSCYKTICKQVYLVAIAISFTSIAAKADSATWQGTGTAATPWSNAGNWNPGVPGTLGTTSNTDTATFSSAATAINITVDSGRNLQNFVFNPGANTYTFSGGPFVLSSGGSITVNSGGTGASAATFSTPISLEGNYSFIDNGTPGNIFTNSGDVLVFSAGISAASAASPLTLTLGGSNAPVLLQPTTGGAQVTGVISDSGAGNAISLVKNGTGLWVLFAANTYSGSTTLDGGVLNTVSLANIGVASGIGKGSAAGSPSDLVFNGGALQYTGFINTSGGPVTTSVSTNRLFTIGDSSSTINTATIDSSDYNGSLPNASSATSGTVSFTGTGAIAFGATAGSHTLILTGVNLGNNMFDLNITDQVGGGPTGLNKTGVGTWVLNNTTANTYSGPTTITGGVLRDASGTGLSPNSLLVLNGGVFETGNSFARTVGTAQGNVEITGGQSGFSANGAPLTVTLSGGNPLKFGTPTFNPSLFILNQVTANNALTLTNGLDLNGASQVIAVNANTATISGSIINSGSTSAALGKSGVGTLILSNTNTYNGGTVVGGGVLSASATGALGSGNVTVNNGSELRLNALNNLGASSTVTLNSSVLGVGFTTTQATLASLVTSGSSGVLALNNSQGTALNMAVLGNGKLYLGSSTGGTYSASTLGIAPGGTELANTDGSSATFGSNYYLGGGDNTLTITGQNVLTDQTPDLLLANASNSLTSSNTHNSVVIGDGSTAGQPNGGGTVDLQASQNYGGSTTVNAGYSLVLDYANMGATGGNIITSSNPVILGGGNITALGANGATDTQTLGGLNTILGTSTVTANSNGATALNLNLGTINAGVGTTIEFIRSGSAATITTNNSSLVGPETGTQTYGNGQFVFNDGTSVGWAGTSSSSGPYTLTKYTGETAMPTTATSATTDYVMAPTTTTTVTPGQSDIMNLFRFSNSGAATLAMGTNTLTVNGVLYNGSANATISGSGGMTSGSGTLYVQNYGTGTLTISNKITGASTAVVYAGPGTDSITGANTYGGNTYLDGSTLLFTTNASGLGTGTGTLFINSGALSTPSNTSSDVISQASVWTGNFSLLRSAAGTVATLGGSGTGPSFNGGVTLANNITITVNSGGLGGWEVGSAIGDQGMGWGLTIGVNSPNGVTINSTSLPVVNGSLTLNGTNTFSGPITVLGDSLSIGSSGATNRNNILALGTNAWVYLTGATIQLAGLNDAGAASGSETIESDTTNGAVVQIDGSGNYSFGGSIINGSANMALTMAGTGTQVLTGVNTFTKAVTVNAGTLIVDASQGGALNGTNPLSLGGGTFEYKGSAAGSSETLGGAIVNAGGSTIIENNNGGAAGATTLNLGALTASAAGGALDIHPMGSLAPNITTTSANNSAGTLGAGGHVVFTDIHGNTTWATVTSGSIGAYMGDTATLPTSGGTTGTTTAYNLTAGQTQVGNTWAALLRISNGSSGVLDLAGTDLTMNQDGLLFNGTAAFSISDSVGGGFLTGATGDKEVIIQNYGAAPLTISAAIANNGSNAEALTIAGPGTTILTDTSTYSGGTYLDGGKVNFNSLANFGTTGITFSGATLQYATGTTTDITTRANTINASGATIDTNGSIVNYTGSVGSGTGGVTYIDSAATHGGVNLNATQNYTGFTMVQNGGHLNLGINARLTNGAGTIVGNNGTLTGGETFATNASQSNAKTNAGAITLQAGGVLTPGNTTTGFNVQGAGLSLVSNGNQNTNGANGFTPVSNNVLNATNLTWNAGGMLNFTLDSTIQTYQGAGSGTGPGTALQPSASTLINLGTGSLVRGSGTGPFILNFQNTGTWDNPTVTGDAVASSNVYDLINFGATSLNGGSNGATTFKVNDFTIENLDGIGTLSFFFNPAGDGGIGQEELLLTVIPEPSTWSMFVGGFVALIFWTRKRKSSSLLRRF